MMFSQRVARGVRTLLPLVVVLVGAGTGLAELPPEAYREMQQQAPEALSIRVRSVSTETSRERAGTRTRVTVRAQVIAVRRSGANLAPGQQIVIAYERFVPTVPVFGPGPVPMLRAGQEYPAFLTLNRETRRYEPAAMSHSFATVRE